MREIETTQSKTTEEFRNQKKLPLSDQSSNQVPKVESNQPPNKSLKTAKRPKKRSKRSTRRKSASQSISKRIKQSKI